MSSPAPSRSPKLFGKLGDPLQIEGTELDAVPMSADKMLWLVAQQDMTEGERMKLFAQASTCKRGTHELVWENLEECGTAPWRVIKTCAEAAMEVNGLTDESDAVGEAEGN